MSDNRSKRPGRRAFTAVLAAAALLGAGSTAAQTAQWPARPVTIVVPYGPGGINDLGARILAERLQRHFGQPFVVENRNGAAGAVGTTHVMRSAPDGYTLLFGNNAVMGIVPVLKPSYDVNSLTPIARVFVTPQVLGIRADLPVQNVPELVAYALKNPGKLNYGSAGVGSFGNFTGELFKLSTKTDIVHVPQNSSGKSVIEMMAGRIDLMFDPAVLAQVKSGKIRVLAATGAQRFPGLPDVPTFREAGGPDINLVGWLGLAGPSRLPKEVVTRLEGAVQQIAADAELQKSVISQGVALSYAGSDELGRAVQSDLNLYKGIKDNANIVAE